MTDLELRRRARLLVLDAIVKASRDDDVIEREFTAELAGLAEFGEFGQEEFVGEVERELRAIRDELADLWGVTR